MEGVTRTRVGYTGGTTKNPTYHNLGDHTETIQIEFDPGKVSYSELADLFWSSHDPKDRPGSRQYMDAAFYHTEDQKRLILKARDRYLSEEEGKIFTKILPASAFYPAEEYHQKYSLQKERALMKVLSELYPDRQLLLDSAAAARLNGYLAGHSTLEELKRALSALELPLTAREKILDSVPQRTR
ncbi:MAG: peptide-methionine (S)-S-oxide reductase [Syntrophobacterales bacterium]|nr:MAG: peptide-methionine (S)-S-oxide reductase [Syntrophobacterales bacterium]